MKEGEKKIREAPAEFLYGACGDEATAAMLAFSRVRHLRLLLALPLGRPLARTLC